ncbi:hypothetical protein [Actinomyces succiniciruminis]|uniref:Uncharacterized protein n=1 Tax=Actinomyces succiniciruminis TaxID=1522002 RepID=A0A1L7RMV7_9ACTO|nr:hypothetical protein [Actinomyces succiniciruminis]CED90634.1 Hypothetical protein AAM4_0802 [Actinomyces succiniciruminis]
MTDPAIITPILVAVVGLAGVLAGQSTSRRMHREDYQLARQGAEVTTLRAVVESLTERVSSLERALAASEARVDALVDARDDAKRDRWHAIDYARQLLTWGHECASLIPDDVDPPPPPEIPPALADDL